MSVKRFPSLFLMLFLWTAVFCGLVPSISGEDDLVIDYETAERLAGLPLACYNQEFPHKFGLTYNGIQELNSPQAIHPIFYGCFDWHSAVHGHWLLAAILNKFPDTDLAQRIITLFDEQFQEDKVAGEMEIFTQEHNKAFERTYGWAWFLKLHGELEQNPQNQERGWSRILQPMADHLVQKYQNFLPSLVYPIRAGEHPNTAFGLIFAYEYAQKHNLEELTDLISFNATGHFQNDANCPLGWEPSGSDFLSPCLQEAELMGKLSNVDQPDEFHEWIQKFLPNLFDPDFVLEPGHVIDRTDGKLVHLDGVNFSRAWNLYSLIKTLPKNDTINRSKFLAMGDEHIRESMESVVGSDYAGAHWLASFLFYALQVREHALEEMYTY